MDERLSTLLPSLGFVQVLGTTEHFGYDGKAVVGQRTPRTCDRNNGTVVVYDESGSPWVMRSRYLDEDRFWSFVRKQRLEWGAYVPHSNDAGAFIQQIFP